LRDLAFELGLSADAEGLLDVVGRGVSIAVAFQ
jgi:hypothetical protein